MRMLAFLVVCLLFVTGRSESDVLVLTKSNFTSELSKHSVALVEFYAPWCGHCKTLTPIYEAAAGELKASGSAVPLAKIDCDANKKVCSENLVQGFPTLKFFHSENGEFYPWEGQRTVKGIVDAVKKHASTSWKPEGQPVIELNDDNLAQYTSMAKPVVVLMYNASDSSSMKPISMLKEFAKKAGDELTIPVTIGKVDLATNPTIKAEHFPGHDQVAPIILGFRDAQAYALKNGRVPNDIATGLAELLNFKPYKLLTSKLLLDTYIDRARHHAAVGIFSEENEAYRGFVSSCIHVRDEGDRTKCVAMFAKEQFDEKYPVDAVTFVQPIHYRTQFDTVFETYTGPWNKNATNKFLASIVTKAQLLTQASDHVMEKRPLILVGSDFGWDKDNRDETSFWRTHFLEVTHAIQRARGGVPIQVVLYNRAEDAVARLMTEFGLDKSPNDVVLSMYYGTKKFAFPQTKDLSKVNVERFITNVLDGEASPVLRSEKPPRKGRNKGVVKTVVASTFEKVVTKSKKDVLIEFYAPWCGHCKLLAPEYKKAAKKLKKEKRDVLVVKYNADANDLPPPFTIQGFPTIFLSLAQDRFNPIKYDGERTAEAIHDFVVNTQKSIDQKVEMKEEL